MIEDEITLHPKVFAKMTYPIYELDKNVMVAEEFPELGFHKEFKGDWIEVMEEDETDGTMNVVSRIKKNHVIRYAMFMYDRNTPLIKFENLEKRKQVAARLAGFSFKSNVLEESTKQVLANSIDEANDIISRWFRIQNHKEFEQLVSGEEFFFSLMAKVRDNISGLSDDKELKAYELKSKAFNDSFDIGEKIDSLKARLFGNNGEIEEVVSSHAKSNFTQGKSEKRATPAGEE